MKDDRTGMIRTKIIATLGPATDSLEAIVALIEAGVDVFRLNLSHGTLEEHGRRLDHIRTACRQRDAVVAVMADLGGPKVRVDSVEGGAFRINPGDHLDIVGDPVLGNVDRISTTRPELVHEAARGHRILIDDGSVRLRVEATQGDRLRCVCEAGGSIATRKGVNLPDTDLAMAALTEKDKHDLAWAIEHDVDYVAMSFVRSAADLGALRESIRQSRSDCRVIAKIETAQAIARLDEIIESSDIVLVARGDLGVEMDLARVPLLQKDISRKCQLAGKPVIIATQMLQSMVEHAVATRAEVSDVANAILDSADCVMLSAETSVGAYPVASVRMLERIAAQTEAYLAASGASARMDPVASMRLVTTAVAHGTSVLARELQAKLVAVWTETGNTVRLLSKCRLNQPIVGLSPDVSVCRRMAPYYGVIPIRQVRYEQTAAMLEAVDALLKMRRLTAPGDLVVVVAGSTSLSRIGSTNALLVHRVA